MVLAVLGSCGAEPAVPQPPVLSPPPLSSAISSLGSSGWAGGIPEDEQGSAAWAEGCWCLPSAQLNPSAAAPNPKSQPLGCSPACPQLPEQFNDSVPAITPGVFGWPQNQSNILGSSPHTKPGIPPAWGVLKLLLFPGCFQRAQILSSEQETAQTLRTNLLWECHHRDPPLSASSSCSRKSHWCWSLPLGMFQLLSLHFLGTQGATPALELQQHPWDILG